MKDDSENKSRGRVGFTLCVVPVLLVLYVLSIGPMHWLVVRNYVSENAWCYNELYAPLDWLCEHSNSFNLAISRYLQFWRL